MNTIKIYTLGLLFSGMFLLSCNSSNSEGDANEATPPPVEEGDVSRYNINQPDESVLKLDSTTVDSTKIDTLKK
ncbi:hypothetical protein [Sphingobacterium humi]|uniref:Cytochrome C551 n=1 Tax=Sphingobacterium humi TaxID=1796905 RepID=A0A6N8KW25_9SPHI|nr:hypothetical protein [Sphingobacterium humi]MVZ60471.1 hypothetical protein [Sphingobacterium humi]